MHGSPQGPNPPTPGGEWPSETFVGTLQYMYDSGTLHRTTLRWACNKYGFNEIEVCARLHAVSALMRAARLGKFSIEMLNDPETSDAFVTETIASFAAPNKLDDEIVSEIGTLIRLRRDEATAPSAASQGPERVRSVTAGRTRARASAGGPRRRSKANSSGGSGSDDPSEPESDDRGLRRHGVEPRRALLRRSSWWRWWRRWSIRGAHRAFGHGAVR